MLIGVVYASMHRKQLEGGVGHWSPFKNSFLFFIFWFGVWFMKKYLPLIT